MELHLPDPFYPVNESEILLPELSNYKFERDKVILNGTLVIDAFEGAKDYQLGGYKPADKWLKDRKGRAFTKHDKKTYERLLATLTETTDIMNEIETAFSFDND